MKMRHALTTGEIAEYCAVNLKTVLRWIERGDLKAYKLPGDRGDNRVEIEHFISFLRKNNMPIPQEFQQKTKRILIVDDDIKAAEAIKRSLHTKGFEMEIAQDGFQAGLLLKSFRPALITLDLHMPGMSGIEVIKYIRGNPEFAGIKILVISAMGQAELKDAVQNGADDALAKGFSKTELIKKIENLFE